MQASISKLITYIVSFLALGALILLGLAYLTPSKKHAEVAIKINAPADLIRPYVNSFRNFNRWQTRSNANAATRYSYRGPDSGKDSIMAWSTPELGSFSQKMTAADNNRIDITVMDDYGQPAEQRYFLIEENDGTTHLTWGNNADVGSSPLDRLTSIKLENQWKNDFNVSLEKLKRIVEAEYAEKIAKETTLSATNKLNSETEDSGIEEETTPVEIDDEVVTEDETEPESEAETTAST